MKLGMVEVTETCRAGPRYKPTTNDVCTTHAAVLVTLQCKKAILHQRVCLPVYMCTCVMVPATAPVMRVTHVHCFQPAL